MSLNAYILRGLPGSGKSTLASQLQPLAQHVHSTDKYFIDAAGIYKFDAKLLGVNHAKNFAFFVEDCKNRVSVVVCDNTNTQHKEFALYCAAAAEYSYCVHVITVGFPKSTSHVVNCHARQTHGVPLSTIEKMSLRFEI
jgi:tRNA uridine 5-carbamoylmethylation protein Kti12